MVQRRERPSDEDAESRKEKDWQILMEQVEGSWGSPDRGVQGSLYRYFFLLCIKLLHSDFSHMQAEIRPPEAGWTRA
jgi:hypothetical protein